MNVYLASMSFRFCFAIVVVTYLFAVDRLTQQTVVRILGKNLNYQKVEDYTFEAALDRASGECRYIFHVNNTTNRNKTINQIKEKVLKRKIKEFQVQKQREQKVSKEYYETVRRETQRRILENQNFPWNVRRRPQHGRNNNNNNNNNNHNDNFSNNNYNRNRNRSKRSNGYSVNRRKIQSVFSKVTFTDHNNCTSRCIFARMEIVNPHGFPDESLVTKLLDDRIMNRRFRLSKKKKVASCFRRMEEVDFDDACIYSTKLFECLGFDEPYLWASNR